MRHLRLNLLRGVLLALASVAFFAALKAMLLADAIAIFFVQPIIVTLLSVLFLKKAIDLRRIAAVFVGFGGALLVIRPNFAALGLVATLPLVYAGFVAVYLVLGRHLSAMNSSLAMHFYAGLGGTVSLASVLAMGSMTEIAEFQIIAPVGAAVWGLLLVMGVFATATHLHVDPGLSVGTGGAARALRLLRDRLGDRARRCVVRRLSGPDEMAGIAIIVASGLVLVWTDRATTRDMPPLPKTN